MSDFQRLFSPALLKFLLTTAAFVSAGQARAAEQCVCANPPGTVQESLQRSSACFVGRVEQTTKSAIKEGYNEVRMVVLDRFKGLDDIRGSDVVIYTKRNQHECGMEFLGGQDYIVFATGNPAGLKVDNCLGSGVRDTMIPKEEELRRLVGRAPKQVEIKKPEAAPKKKPVTGLSRDLYFELGPDALKQQPRN
jgi:hypothetical protein